MTKIITTLNGTLIGCTDNPSMTFDELKAIKEQDGEICYEVTDAQFTNAQDGWDFSLVNGVPSFTKGADAIAKEQSAIQQANNEIYFKIGQLAITKAGKEAAGVNTDAETAEIEALKLQLIV